MTHCPGPGRSKPALVAITNLSGYGCNASAMSRSETSGPYEFAVAMKFTPSSSARWSTRRHSSGSAGSPKMPGPVICIAPYPSRCTGNSPPSSNVPDAAASCSVVSVMPLLCPGTSTLRMPDSAPMTTIEYLDAQAQSPFWKAASKATVDALDLRHGTSALDVGCGTGDAPRHMAAATGTAVGVDRDA